MIKLIALALLLSGCSTVTKTVYVPQEVEVVVTKPCLNSEQIPVEPEYALDKITKENSVLEKGIASLQEIEQRKNWQSEATALLGGCIIE